MKITDKIADLAKKKFKSKSFTFYDLLNLIESEKMEIKIDPSNLYINIIEDVRFLSIGKQKWRIRETLKYEEVEKIKQSMFGNKEYQELESYEESNVNFKDEKIDENSMIIDSIEDIHDDDDDDDDDHEIKEEE